MRRGWPNCSTTLPPSGPLVEAYRRPNPLLADGRALAPIASAMMDVSDGLLLDASRLAAASGLAVRIDLATLPLSAAFLASRGEDRLFAATGGDDYALLVALPETVDPFTLSLPSATRVTAIGRLTGVRDCPSPTAKGRCRSRSSWDMNIAAYSTRQWIVALIGLASGMATAVLLH